MARRKSLRCQLYRAARDLGDVQAASRGPSAYARRRVRKVAYRKSNGLLASILRALGL
ncbi:MAG: hypothetical protein ACYCXA_13895 [Actinomycetes bacterium]